MATLTPLTLTFWMPENEYEFAICGSVSPTGLGPSTTAGVGANKEVIPPIARSVTTAVAILPTTGMAETAVAAAPAARTSSIAEKAAIVEQALAHGAEKI